MWTNRVSDQPCVRNDAEAAHIVGQVYCTEVVRRRDCLGAQGKRVRNLEGGVHGKTLGEVSAGTVEEEVGQVRVCNASVNDMRRSEQGADALLTSLVRLSTVPGAGRSSDFFHDENRW